MFDWSNVCSHSAITDHNHFLNFLINYNIKHLCHHYYGFNWDNRQIDHRLIFIHGLSYVGTKECDIGKGTLYAIPKYNKNDECKDSVKPRHDFILINRDTNNPSTLACIVLMFQLDKKLMKLKRITIQDIGEKKIFIIVQHLIKCSGSTQKVIRKFGEEYQWAGDPKDPTKFHYEIIVAQSILRPVMVVPSVTRINKTKHNCLYQHKY